MAPLLDNVSREDLVRSVDHVIRSRETKKVLGEAGATWDHPIESSSAGGQAFDLDVKRAIAIAGWAPFHHSRKELDVHGDQRIHEPWRFYHLDRAACVALLRRIDEVLDPNVRRGKIPGLLSGAGATVLVTWLPELPVHQDASSTNQASDPPDRDLDKMQLRNEEHLAATAAAVQNLLLSCEARGMETYWSSGGLLRDPHIFRLLGIRPTERLLAAIFLTPPLHEYQGIVDCKPGSLRNARAEPSKWCLAVTFDD